MRVDRAGLPPVVSVVEISFPDTQEVRLHDPFVAHGAVRSTDPEHDD
jgi:hypothetical protein